MVHHCLLSLRERAFHEPTVWHPPVELSSAAQTIIKRIRRSPCSTGAGDGPASYTGVSDDEVSEATMRDRRW